MDDDHIENAVNITTFYMDDKVAGDKGISETNLKL